MMICGNDNVESGLESLQKAKYIEPKLKKHALMIYLMRARGAREKNEGRADTLTEKCQNTLLTTNPLVLNRDVEGNLISTLY